MRRPEDAPFLRATFSLRRRSSSAFISSSGMVCEPIFDQQVWRVHLMAREGTSASQCGLRIMGGAGICGRFGAIGHAVVADDRTDPQPIIGKDAGPAGCLGRA